MARLPRRAASRWPVSARGSSCSSRRSFGDRFRSRPWSRRRRAPGCPGLPTDDAREPRHDPLASGTDGHRVYLPPALALGISERGSVSRRADASFPETEEAVALYRLLAVQQAARLVRGTPVTAAQIHASATRATGFCSRKRRPSIGGWLCRPRVWTAPCGRRGPMPSRVAGKSAPRFQTARDRAPGARRARRPSARARARHGRARFGRRVARLGAGRDQTPSCDDRYRPVAPAWYWGRMLEPPSPIPSLRRSSLRSRRRAQRSARVSPRCAGGRVRARRPKMKTTRGRNVGDSRRRTAGERRGPVRSSAPGRSRRTCRSGRVWRIRCPTCRKRASCARRGRRVRCCGAGERRQRVEVAPARGPSSRHCLSGVGLSRGPVSRAGRDRARACGAAWETRRGSTSALARHARLDAPCARPVRAPAAPPRAAGSAAGRIGASISPPTSPPLRTCAPAPPLTGACMWRRGPPRRELAVALLAGRQRFHGRLGVRRDRRIVDVEKEALLVVCEALDALGDRYGVFAFSGESADDVSVLPLKTFDERVGLTVRPADCRAGRRPVHPPRSAYSSPHGGALPRTGASPSLAHPLRWQAERRGRLRGSYGVEDTRQAVAEARRQGVAVFCLTVDREAPRYASRIFGRAGFAVLHRTEQLPSVLVDVLRQLIRR